MLAIVAVRVLLVGVFAAGERKPNLIFVFSDQQSSDMLGCYGNRDIITPNLDRMAREGVRFNHCVSNSPVCTPYRGILLSGQHSLYNGAFANDLQMLPGNGNYLGEVLRDGGYHTGYYGKWHLYGGERVRGIPPGPCRYGFDDEFLSNNCTTLYDAKRAYYWSQDGKEKILYGDWEPYAQTKQALDFIDRHAGKPFALFVSWHPPHNWGGNKHAGYHAPEDLLALYDPAKLHLRPTVEDTPHTRQMYQGHMAMITGIDRCMGMLFEKLKERGLAENTIVIFTSDHGDLLASYGWKKNKGRAEAGSCRVPLLIRWPAQLKPGVSDLLVGAIDLMPTLLGLLDLRVPRTCQGRDASRAIINGTDDGVDMQPLYFMPTNWRGVYTKRYTYSESLHDSDERGVDDRELFNVLYDRQNDPWETRNLFHDPEAAGIRRQLHEATLGQMARFGDTGMRCREILRRVTGSEAESQLGLAVARRERGWEGVLKGRPIDLINRTPPAPAATQNVGPARTEGVSSK